MVEGQGGKEQRFFSHTYRSLDNFCVVEGLGEE
jgi:hypothetical protein